MKKDKLDCIGYIDDLLIEKADKYTPVKKKNLWTKWAALAACLVLVFSIGGISTYFNGSVVVTAYAYGTNEKITSTGAVIDTGTISDSGEMKGHPLMFYLSGEDIETVRFSCKNQKINFVDWTEKRDEYGNAQNFTVLYGKDKSEYYYLTIDWIPDATIRELTDNTESTIATLPKEMREDIIVMEITFANGKTAVKAITISLLDDGKFYTTFDDYTISESDDFVRRPDSKAVRHDIRYGDDITIGTDIDEDTNGIEKLSDEEIESAKQTALKYYSNTVFEVNAIEYVERGSTPFGKAECNFTVNVSKGGVVQDPDRIIQLERIEDGLWRVVNEGY